MISAHKSDKYGATGRQDLNNGSAKSEEKRLSDWMAWWELWGVGHFFILLFMASNSIAPCEATEQATSILGNKSRVCVRACVCVCARIRACMHVRTYTHMCVHIHERAHFNATRLYTQYTVQPFSTCMINLPRHTYTCDHNLGMAELSGLCSKEHCI